MFLLESLYLRPRLKKASRVYPWLCWLLIVGQPMALAAEPLEGEPTGILTGVVDLEQSRKELGLEKRWTHAEVELKREFAGWAADPRRGIAAEPIEALLAHTDADGAFRLAGLQPGIYSVTIRGLGARPLVRRGIRVEAGRETALTEPFVVIPASTLPLRLAPVRDPWNRPWKALLLSGEGQKSRQLAEAFPNEEGFVLFSDLDEGVARIEIRDADGRLWLEQHADVYPDRSEVFLGLDLVAVEGRLHYGPDRLAGVLSFGTTQSPIDIRMESDKDGRFRGYLPNEGLWEVEVLWPGGDLGGAQRLRPLEVRRRPGKSFADLEIRIPQTELVGKVSFRGAEIAGAGITVLRENAPGTAQDRGSAREAVVLTDDEGRFRLRGLEPGSLSLLAAKDGRSSGWTRLELEEKSWPTELHLELEEQRRLSGIVSFGAQPVAGAVLLARSPGDAAHGQEYFEAVSDSEGLFEFELPTRIHQLDLLVAAPTLGTEIMQARASEHGWEALIVPLQNENGTLRYALSPAAAATDLGSSFTLEKNGARFRLNAVLRLLTTLGQLHWEPGHLLLRDLAPGSWQICSELEPANCRSGELAANGELTLAPQPGKEHSK